VFPPYKLIRKDLRHIEPGDLAGMDAVIHLAALSNDPLGKIDESLTYDINYRATIRLAEIARENDISRFIFASSCSLYGDGRGAMLDETSISNPQTAYGKSKIQAENELSKLANDTFSPTFLRNATAFGISPRMRFDIVVNNLAGYAKTTSKIQILGDGKPWRPLVHIHDICSAAIRVLGSDRGLIHNQAFNVGSEKENYQIRTIAEIVKKYYYSDCEITIAQKNSGDTRDYKVSFEKIFKLLGFSSRYALSRGVIEIGETYEQVNLDDDIFHSDMYTRLKQINHLMDINRIDEKLHWIKNQI
jgi:nucleoside-diphosphate-sugar epimerase